MGIKIVDLCDDYRSYDISERVSHSAYSSNTEPNVIELYRADDQLRSMYDAITWKEISRSNNAPTARCYFNRSAVYSETY